MAEKEVLNQYEKWWVREAEFKERFVKRWEYIGALQDDDSIQELLSHQLQSVESKFVRSTKFEQFKPFHINHSVHT